jgi:adhesin transport system outer membrane protein
MRYQDVVLCSILVGGILGAPVDIKRTWTIAFARGGVLAAAVVCALTFSVPRYSAAQTLQDELYHLVKTHPRIEEQRAILRRANEAVTTSRSGYLPTVSLSGSAGGNIVSNPTTRGTNHDNELVRFNALGIEIRQNLYDGGFTPNSVDSALMARDSVTYALESTVQRVMLQGITTYLNVLRLNELIRVARARERTIREQLQLETERVERGAGIEVDVLQAKSRLQLAIEQRVDLEGQLRQAMSEYILHFNREPDITQMRLEPSPIEIVPPTIEDALFTAREENPLLSGNEFLARAARFTVEAERSGYLPVLDLVGRVDHESNVGGTRGLSKDSAVLIEMSWEIFSGFRTDAAVTSAQETLIERLSAADRTKREIERQVRQAWTKLENTRDRKELLLNAVSIAQEVFTARQKLRDAGKETTLNVLDAENEVFQAEQNLIRADYDTRVAVYELAVAMGIMTPALLGIDVQIIENPEEYITGAGKIIDPEPDTRVQEYRDRIQAETPTPLNRAKPPAPPTNALPEETDAGDAQDQPQQNTDSVIEPPPADGTTGGLDRPAPSPVTTDASPTPSPVTDNAVTQTSDSIATAREIQADPPFAGEFAVPQDLPVTEVTSLNAPATAEPLPAVPEAQVVAAGEGAEASLSELPITDAHPDAPEAEPVSAKPTAEASAEVPPRGPDLLEAVRSLFGASSASSEPVALAEPTDVTSASASLDGAAERPVSLKIDPVSADHQHAPAPQTLNEVVPSAGRSAVAKLEPVMLPKVVRDETDAIAVRPNQDTAGAGAMFDIPGTLLFGDVPPPR